jgi:cell division protein FtsB
MRQLLGRITAVVAVAPAMVLAAVTSITCAAAEPGTKPSDPNGAAKPAAAASSRAPRVFTNKDLAKYHSASGPGSIVVNTMASQEKSDAESPASGALYPEEKERKLQELNQAISDAEARMAYLDKRGRAVVNPFERRPVAPTEDDKKAESGMGAKEVYDSLQSEKAALTDKLAALRAEMDKLIATPTQPHQNAAPTNPAAEAPQPQP